MQNIKILLADDHNYFLDGLQADIEQKFPGINVYRANNGLEILKVLKQREIDVLISDIQMPEQDGLKTARIIKKEKILNKIIILTSYYDIQNIKALLNIGINVILDKENVKSDIKEAIKCVLEDKRFFSPIIQNTVEQIIAGKRKTKQKTAIPELTRREKELIELIASGLSNKEIGKKISLSPATIDTHRTNIYFKFEVNNAAKLAVKAFRLGIID